MADPFDTEEPASVLDRGWPPERCPDASCHSEEIEVGPGRTALCNTCGRRWS